MDNAVMQIRELHIIITAGRGAVSGMFMAAAQEQNISCAKMVFPGVLGNVHIPGGDAV